MPTANNQIKFVPCAKSEYDNLLVKDDDTIYFITDEYKIYVGSHEYTKSLEIINDVPTTDTPGVEGKLYYYPDGPTLYIVHKVLNHYSWSAMFNRPDGVMMLAPEASSQEAIAAVPPGQLFTSTGGVGLKTGGNSYIQLAKLSSIPKNISDLNNDSNFQIAQTTYPEVPITEYHSQYIPDVTDSAFTDLTIGQYFYFVCGEYPHFCVKTGESEWQDAWWTVDYKAALNIPTATSELVNDSGFISHMPDVFIGTTDKSSPETGTDEQVYYVGDRYINKSNGKLWICAAVTLDETTSPELFVYTWTYVDVIYDISSKANIETNELVTSYAQNTQEADGYTLTGDYSIIGDTCFLRGTAKCISGETVVYYSLPESCLHPSSTIAVAGNNIYTISTTTINNTPAIEIRQSGSQQMTNDTIQFTLIYKCR